MRALSLWSLFISCGALAQSDHFWAIPASHAHVALFQSADSASPRIATLTSDDVLLTRCDGSAWCWAQDQLGGQGYVLRERIISLTTLDDSSAIAWMKKVFRRERHFGEQLNASHGRNDLARQQAYGDSLNHQDLIYGAALSLFEPLYCRTADITVLHSFMRAVVANPGSAREEPHNKLAAAFKCRPDEFKTTMWAFKTEDRDMILDATTTGLWLTYDERDPAQQAERDRLIGALKDQ